MHILLINTNPVVSRLLSLCMRDDDTVLEEITDVSEMKRDSYDMLFVDDASCVLEVQSLLPNLQVGKKIFLSGKEGVLDTLEDFDEVISKPFLPSQITALLKNFESIKENEEENKEEKSASPFIFPLSQEDRAEEVRPEEDTPEEEKRESLQDPEVLDGNEIERIKALLEEDEESGESLPLADDDYEARKVEVITEHLEADGLEIISEDEIVDILSSKTKKKKAKKEKIKKEEKRSSKKAKKAKKEEVYTFEEALLAAIEGMKPKKIKKLLKDAEISIQIKFKDRK